MRLLGLLLAVFALAAARAEAAGEIYTVAGNGTRAEPHEGQVATRAGMNVFPALAALPDGTFLVAGYSIVWHVDAQGRLRAVAGTGDFGDSGDAGPAVRARLQADELAALPGGGFLICDILAGKIRMVDPQGVITTVAGGGRRHGDGVPATQADLDPYDVAALPGGGFVISDFGHRVRRVGPDGVIRSIAGNGRPPRDTRPIAGRATAAAIDPKDIATAPDGSVLIVNADGAQVDRITPDGAISSLTPPRRREAFAPQGIAAAADGGLLVSDEPEQGPGRVWRFGPDGTISVLAGGGPFIATAPLGLQQHLTGQPALAAEIEEPGDVAALPDGGVLLSDGAEDIAEDGGLVRYIAPAAPQRLAVAILRDRDRVFGPGRPSMATVALTQPATVVLTVAGRTSATALPAGVSRLPLPGPPRGRRPLALRVAATLPDGRRAYDRVRIYPASPYLPEETARLVITDVRSPAAYACRRFGPTRLDCETHDDLDRCGTVSATLVHRRLRWGAYGCGFQRHPRYRVAPHAIRRREWLCDVIDATCPPRELFGRVDAADLAPAD